MPQVWLDDEELGEFLECEPGLARHYAVQNEWPRRTCVDGVSRYVLPPGPALKYVLWNARSRPAPRDAALLKRALGQARELQRQLADAQATIAALQHALEIRTVDRTDEIVSALKSMSDEMRDRSDQDTSAAQGAA